MFIDTTLNLGPRYSPTSEPNEVTCYCGETFYEGSDDWEEHTKNCEIRKQYEC